MLVHWNVPWKSYENGAWDILAGKVGKRYWHILGDRLIPLAPLSLVGILHVTH